MPLSSSARGVVRACLWIAALAATCVSAQTRSSAKGLAELSLEELSELPVTSVSGRPESLRSASASVFVISGEDIRRSAATSLPEALRLAPNLQVARLSSGQYAISARGFNNAIANKLLVLIDGRTIYSTLFSGVFWDFHDLVLEDIERIEVISGPGGTLWGANAVNGIINVITKPAAATQGTLVSVTRSGRGGQESVRWGGSFGETGHLRLYGLAVDRAATRRPDGVERADAGTKQQAGFRAEQQVGGAHLTVQGDVYRGGEEAANTLAPKLHGSNLLTRWEDRFADGSSYRLQAYYDLQARDELTGFRNRAETVDVQFAHEPRLAGGHQLLWGAGYRVGKDRNETSPALIFVPAERRLTWANIFAQHQLRQGKWQLTTGAKAERNSYTGVELLPNLRLAYDHDERTVTWGALSRAVRAPARLDRELLFPGTPPFFIVGGANLESETANVAEIGHRGQVGNYMSYSATLFRQHYKGLRGGIGTPLQIANRVEGNVDGLETWAQAQPSDWMRFTLGYLRLRQDLRFSGPPADAISIPALGNDPRSQWTVRSQFDLGAQLELDLQARHVGALPSPTVPAYTVADARLGWQLSPAVELSLLAQNLTNRRHVEFNAPANASLFGRRLFLRVVVQL
jgi:iron complex outermembrane receptor protein